MRFAPPPTPLPVELTWLLAAAFGPEPPPPVGDPRAVAELARRFDLGPRIVARYGTTAVKKLLGAAADKIIQEHRRAVALGLAGDRTARALARVAEHLGLRMIFLKGFALQHLAPGPIGWRAFVDLDVLLSRAHAGELRDALTADGWAAAEEPGNPQHLPPVRDPEGIPVDIHFRLRGVRVATERWATADELIAADLCRPAGLGDGCWLPRRALLAAHLAVHAVEQHGHRPATYPLMRSIADIVDLTATGRVDRRQVAPLVGESLTDDESVALFTLASVLAEGRTPMAEDDAERDAETLLRHIVAGTLDQDYRHGLAIDHTAGRLRQARQDGELMRYIALKLRSPGSSAGSGPVRRRILRPFQLAARFTSAAAARLRRALDR